MQMLDRFLNYINIETGSVRESDTQPSNFQQFDLIHLLVYELKEMGIEDVVITNEGILYVNIPATKGYERCRSIGFLTHLDTFPGFSGEQIHPQIIRQYDGGDVRLGESGLVLSTAEYPKLKELKGQTLITTDGTTLLGADDKAGIAEVMGAMERIMTEKIPHGVISLAFLGDEEIGLGAERFQEKFFASRQAYTVDGWEVGEIVDSNFNASQVNIRIRGRKMHTGRAKGKMINAQLIGIEIQNRLPQNEIPAMTEGEEGFYHLLSFEGSVAETAMIYQIRDLDETNFRKRIETLRAICDDINARYPKPCIVMEEEPTYRNMQPMIKAHYHLVEHAVRAVEAVGLEPKVTATRGGTVGSRLSYRGLPCPNLGVGGDAYHSPLEHITLEAMENVRDILVEIVKNYANKSV